MLANKKDALLRFPLRLLFYAAGLFLVAIGVVLSINSDLGVSPVNSLPYIISRISGIPMGTCVTAVFCCCIALQVFLLRGEFQLIQLTQILFSVLFGYFVDIAGVMLGEFALPTLIGRYFMLAVSIVLIALGLAIYLRTGLVPMAMEGFTLALTRRIGKLPFSYIKIAVDCTLVAAGSILSILFLGQLAGIREGTLIAAIAVGKVVGILQNWFRPVSDKLGLTQQETGAEVTGNIE